MARSRGSNSLIAESELLTRLEATGGRDMLISLLLEYSRVQDSDPGSLSLMI